MRLKAAVLNLSLFVCIFLFLNISGFAQCNNSEINQLADCWKLINTGKTQAEKDELQKDYWTLLGIVSDLSNYRQMFLQKGNLIDLFPTAYYHTTYAEMQNILALKFMYPIETMKQMIEFYDAYEWNRMNWDKGNKSVVEEHWKRNFEDAESWTSDVNFLCIKLSDVLSAATKSHVVYDLPRAIQYAANQRFNPTIPISEYNTLMYPDFKAADGLFGNTLNKAVADISSSHNGCLQFISKYFTTNTSGVFFMNVFNEAGLTNTLSDVDVIELRHKSWQEAFTGQPLFEPSETIISPQPVLSHNSLIGIGKNLCPPDPVTEEHHKELLGTWLGHVSDMYTHKCQPQSIQITIHKFTKDSVILTRINMGQKIPDTLFTALPCRFTNNRQMTIYLSKDNTLSELYDSVQIGFAFDSINRQRLYGRPCFNYWVGATQVNQNSLVFSKKFTTNNHKLFDLIDIPNKDSLRFIGSLVGATTPDELAKVLLKALQTNNKELWVDCINPTTAQEYRDDISNDFDVVHDSFEKGGITNWNLVQAYRLTYDTCRGCQPVDGSRLLLNFLIEFSYGKEAFVSFSISRIHTYQGRYYTDGCKNCNVVVRQKN